MNKKMLYFEVWIDNHPDRNFCIRGVRPPTVEEANAFCKEDIKRIGAPIFHVEEISKEEAMKHFSFEDEDKWPIFGLGKRWSVRKDVRRAKYYEVVCENGRGRKSVLCIRAIRPPSLQEADDFCRGCFPRGMKVKRIIGISSETAHHFHVCDGKPEPNVFGLDKTAKTEDQKPNNDSRPSWDEYFLRLAKDVSTRSNCCRRKVGAVIVKDNHIVATGYNGTPAKTTNCFDGGCPRCNGEHKTGEKLDECLCVHAEQNAICQAAKHGNCIDGGKIYVTCSPCLTCLKLIINSGIKEVIFGEWYREFNDQEKKLVKESGIKVKKTGGTNG